VDAAGAGENKTLWHPNETSGKEFQHSAHLPAAGHHGIVARIKRGTTNDREAKGCLLLLPAAHKQWLNQFVFNFS